MRQIATWILLLVSGVCFAQQGGTAYGITSIQHKGWGFNASITGVPEEGKRFSGTNVEIGVATLAQPITGYTDPDRWTEVSIISFGVTIGGDMVTNPSAPIGTAYSYGITFSSTHFPDGNNLIPIKLKVEFKGKKNNSSNPEFIEIEVIVKFKAYNKGVLLATARDNGGGEAAAAKDACNRVGALLEAMNHTVKPKGGNPPNFDGAQSLAKADVLDLIAKSTVFFACTHGFLTSIEDSNGVKMTWAEIRDAGLTNRQDGAPSYNLVFYAACNTANADANNGEDAASSFWSGNPESWKDRAWLGFNLPLLVGEKTSHIADYCERYFGLLKDGCTAWVARQKAGYVRGGRGSTTRPVLVGDKKTTLTTVYEGVMPKWYRTYLPQLQPQ